MALHDHCWSLVRNNLHRPIACCDGARSKVRARPWPTPRHHQKTTARPNLVLLPFRTLRPTTITHNRSPTSRPSVTPKTMDKKMMVHCGWDHGVASVITTRSCKIIPQEAATLLVQQQWEKWQRKFHHPTHQTTSRPICTLHSPLSRRMWHPQDPCLMLRQRCGAGYQTSRSHWTRARVARAPVDSIQRMWPTSAMRCCFRSACVAHR